MRIIGGSHNGKILIAPKTLPVRPTTDFAKEGLFNILNNKVDFEGLIVLDLFCGTGNISLEFASRGAQTVLAVDSHAGCTRFVKDTAKQFGFHSVITDKADVFKFLKSHVMAYDIIFADPPYEMENIADIHKLVFEKGLLKEKGLLIIEHGPSTKLDDREHFMERRKYGNVNFSFFGLQPKD